MNLVDAPNTRKVRKVWIARSARAAIACLRKRRAATAADDYGAINAYDDRDGNYRCQAYRFMQTVDDQTFTSLVAVGRWYAVWLKKIGERAATA